MRINRTEKKRASGLLRFFAAILLLTVMCTFAVSASAHGAQTAEDGSVIITVSTPSASTPEPQTPAPATPMQTEAPGTPEPAQAPRPFTIVWIADTQTIIAHAKPYFQDMTRYTEEHREELNVLCLIHTGDYSSNLRWTSQRNMVIDAFAELKETPVLAVAGNHDFGKSMSDYRPFYTLPVIQNMPAKYVYKDGRGVYGVFDADGTEVVIVGLSYGTRGVKAAQKWARDIFQAHPNAIGIFFCHQFVAKIGVPLDDHPFTTDIIAQCPNVRLVLCGHSRIIAHTEIRVKDDPASDDERVVNVLCFDYQLGDPLNGSYMQLLTFDPVKRTISVNTYSPSKDDYVCHDDKPEEECFVLENAF